jgi:hypothetical protein
MQARNNYFPVQTLKDSPLLRTLFTIDVGLVQLKPYSAVCLIMMRAKAMV